MWTRLQATQPTLPSEQLSHFDFKGLDCLPVANCTTGAQRFLAALSNRGTHHGPHARPDHRRSSCRAGDLIA